jgi:hypothetical protein
MLLGLMRFRWSRMDMGDGEWLTVGEILDGLIAARPPLPTYRQLFPTAAPPFLDLVDPSAPPPPNRGDPGVFRAERTQTVARWPGRH